jgi:eukaryotic-like serine/threonine-protein kinase
VSTPSERPIGRYRLIDRLGAGGMGEVYLAEDPALGRKVAVKRVPLTGGVVPDALARLRREAQAAARISHPGVAAVYDVVEQDGSPYVVMEYVPGTDLSSRLAHGPLNGDEVVAIGTALADALAAAHAQGVIHRDLKPSNIRVTPDGHLKILDFGISKVLEPLPAADAPTDVSPALTRIGDSLGTPGYSAPEQLLGQPVDARADVFSLGVTLYELATGHAPFRRDTILATVLASMQHPPPRADTLNAAISAHLADVLARAMAAEADARFESAKAFKAALAATSGAAGALPTGATGAVPSGPPVHATPTRYWLGAGAVVLLAATLAVATWVWRTPAPTTRAPGDDATARVIAVLPPENLSGEAANDFLAVGLADSLFTDLSGLPGIRVVSPSDVRADTLASRRDAPAIARSVGAVFLVESSIQRAGEQIRINARLLAADGGVLWRGDFQGEMATIFDLQRRFARGVIDGLDVRMNSDQRARLDVPATRDVAALSDYWRGRLLLERTDLPEQVDAAIAAFESALARDDRFADAYAGLAEASWARYGHTGDTANVERAVASSERALALDASQPRVWVTLALVRNGTGHSDRALEDLRRAIDLQPGNDDSYRLLGDVLAGRAEWEAAEDAYRRAVSLRPGYWRNHYRLGVLFYRVGRFGDAVEAFRQATTLEPDAAAGYQAMGTAQQASGDLAGARANYERAIAIGPTRNAYSNLGIVHYWEGRYHEAVKAFEDAIARYPTEAVFHRNLGDALRRIGDTARAETSYGVAVTLYEQRLAVNAEDANARAELAVVEMKRGRVGRAREQIELARLAAPGDADVLYSLAVVLSLSGRPHEALPVLEQAMDAGVSALSVRYDDDLAAVRALPAYRARAIAP